MIASYTVTGLIARSTPKSYWLGSVVLGTVAQMQSSLVPSAVRQSMPNGKVVKRREPAYLHASSVFSLHKRTLKCNLRRRIMM